MVAPKSFFAEQAGYAGMKGPMAFLMVYSLVSALSSVIAQGIMGGAKGGGAYLVGLMIGGACGWGCGFVDVDSEVGRGSTFSILLPRHVRTEPEEDAGLEAKEPRAPADLTGSARILLVEDEEAVRAFAARASVPVKSASITASAATALSDDAVVMAGRWQVERPGVLSLNRFTMVMRRDGNDWKIAHFHSSPRPQT